MAHSGDFLAGSGVHLDPFNMNMGHEEYTGQVGKYGKEFDINMTRIASKDRQIRDSMLSYSEHARKTHQSRLLSDSLPDVSLLRVRARHIPDGKQGQKLKPLAASGEDVSSRKQDDLFQKKMVRLRSERKKLDETDELLIDECRNRVGVAEPDDRQAKRSELALKSVANLADLDELVGKRRRERALPRQIWTEKQSETGTTHRGDVSPTNALVQESLRESQDNATEEDDSPAARAERARKRREAKTRLLLRDAIASLQALEENIKNPLLTLPRARKGKRLKLPKGTLDVIPEIKREDDPDNNDADNGSKIESSVDLTSTWRSEPGYKARTYRHVYPYSNNATVLDDGRYSIKSDPFQSRTTRVHCKNGRLRSIDATSGSKKAPTVHASSDQDLYDPEMHNKERKRRLQEHARVRLRKPLKIKFLKNDLE